MSSGKSASFLFVDPDFADRAAFGFLADSIAAAEAAGLRRTAVFPFATLPPVLPVLPGTDAFPGFPAGSALWPSEMTASIGEAAAGFLKALPVAEVADFSSLLPPLASTASTESFESDSSASVLAASQ